MAGLNIAPGLTLPLDAVTQTLGCIGRKGAGKTYLASMLAEQMLDAHAQIIILDPVGNWFGLRVGADGKSKGKDIFVIGGEHGDVPIIPEAGARIGKLLTEKSISAVIDISGFRQGERKRFAADFAEEFFHRKKFQRSAVHLFVEEAQLFAPQFSGKDEARMLGAFENIIRLGRNYGIGATLITQRPQSVNKEVLTQVECLCVLQVNGVPERKALKEWMHQTGESRDELIGELPGLSRGEGYVWSPSWLRMFRRVHFAKKTTFDASSTPEVGRQVKATILSSIDVEALKADMQEVIQQAEKDDPRALRAKIAALEARKPVADDTEVQALRREVALLSEELRESRALSTALNGRIVSVIRLLSGDESVPKLAPLPPLATPPRLAPSAVPKPVRTSKPAGAGKSLPKAERSILTVLAQHGASTKSKIAAVSGYAVSSGGFNNAMSALRTKGFLSGSNPCEITVEGIDALGSWEPLPSGLELLNFWMGRLPKAERGIIEALAGRRSPMTKDELGNATGYASTGGGFNNALSHLRTLELIQGSGSIYLTDDFAEAVRC